MAQDATDLEQELLSVKFGRGEEHQLPTLYSQEGVGVTVVVVVH
jgi:hypothetical protein